MTKKPLTAFESETFGQDVSFKLEQPVGSMSISPCGRDVVLASREGLHIIDLDSPWDPPRYLPHHTSWEVADVQWSPFGARDNWVASTSNQKALLWNLDAPASDAVDFVLHGHTRAITDINFSAHDPNVLATCAVDSFVHIWDLTSPQRPAISFSDWFAGATQVKWSRQDSNVIASSHDKYLRIWDKRKGAYPVRSIEAHGTKIYGVDWNRFHANKIVTCSLDKTVKFWNIENLEDVPDRVIVTPFPVWRARHTPFGWGLLAMPQRNSGDLYMYNRQPNEADELPSGPVPPAKIFRGHEGQVKEFLWRTRGNIEDGVDHRDFQLVSWGTDHILRLHVIDPETNLSIGYEKGASKTQRLNFTRRGAKYRTFRSEPSDSYSPTSNISKLDSPSTTHTSFKLRPRTNTNIGMNKALPRFRGWVQNGGVRTGMGMYGRSTTQHQMNPIAWMRNVKIKYTWAQETLADEITQVGEQFPKVNFEAVNVQTRRATISMYGPWGEERAPLYIRIDMKFARAYPAEGTVEFSLQKTSSMTTTLHDTLCAEMQAIARAYATRRKGCLEAMVHYLLRDQTKDNLVSWVLEESMVDSKFLQDTDMVSESSSSDDEDERLDNGNGLRIPPDMLNANARVPVAKGCGALWSDSGKLVCFFPSKPKEPASFPDQFDPKEQEHLRSGTYDGFGYLGAASLGLKSIHSLGAAEDSDDSENSSSSSSTSSSPAEMLGSMSAGVFPKKIWHLSTSGIQRSRSANRSNQSTNDLQTIGAATDKLLNFVSIHAYDDLIPSKRELALEYKVFGNGPHVCGHNAEVALKAGLEQIASVWRLAGLILKDGVPLECHRDLKSDEDIIIIAQKASSLLKRKDSGIDLSYDIDNRPRRLKTSGRVRWGNSPLGPGYLIKRLMSHFEVKGDVQMLAMLSCVFAEPKADQVEDIETLLRPHRRHELSMQIKAPAFSVDYFPSLEIARSILDSTTASFKTSYAASARPSLHNKSSNVSPDVLSGNIPEIGESSSTASASPRSKILLGARDVRYQSHKATTRDHEVFRPGPPSTQSASVSLSTSPEDSRMSRRSNSSLAFSFSRTSLTALAQSYANFPPANSTSGVMSSGIKKFSPSGSLTPGGWNTVGIFGGTGTGKSPRTSQQSSGASSVENRDSLSHASISVSEPGLKRAGSMQGYSRSNVTSLSNDNWKNTLLPQSDKRNATRQIKFKVVMHHQDRFDGDGSAPVPLLSPKVEWKFKSYRASYAYLLGVWGLYPQMSEVLKFDGLQSYFVNDRIDDACDDEAMNALRIGNARRRRTFIEASRAEAAERKGLELRQNCNDCGKALTAIEKNGEPFAWHCVTAHCTTSPLKKSMRVFCTICNNAIDGLMVPCMSCGHVTCQVCALAWFGSSLTSASSTNDRISIADAELSPESTESKYCPSGCGCECSTHEFVSAPPPVELQLEGAAKSGELTRQKSYRTTRSDRLMSKYGRDPAIAALLSLARTRSVSTIKSNAATVVSQDSSSAIDAGSELSSDDDLKSWPKRSFSRFELANGGGLHRNLSTKSSEVTLRRPEAK